MTLTRLVRAELRKLTTTKMPLAFLLVLIALSTTTAIAVIFGTDADGSKTFISTADDQRSLMAFAANATRVRPIRPTSIRPFSRLYPRSAHSSPT